jgi:GT2 family glycosyltransferase
MGQLTQQPRGAEAVVTTVLVTSYRRPDQLAACLGGLHSQTRPAEEVVVVLHASDAEGAAVLGRLGRAWPELRCAIVDLDGSVAALNRGLAAARGELVAIIDDDAVPHDDWLERIVGTFASDARIAAVGGRDVVIVDGEAIDAPRERWPSRHSVSPEVGRIQWFGRMIANHHVGSGEPRDVDVLKGTNMSLRRANAVGLGYDERLLGRGAIVHTELSVCLPLKRQGLRIVYDPDIVVHHHPARRPHGDERVGPRGEAVFAAAHNEALQILDHFGPARRVAFLAWGLLAGTTDAPGLAVLARDRLRGRSGGWLRFRATQRGRAAAIRTRRTPRATASVLATRSRDSYKASPS